MLMYYMPFFDGSNYFSVDNVRLDLEFLSPKQVENFLVQIHALPGYQYYMSLKDFAYRHLFVFGVKGFSFSLGVDFNGSKIQMLLKVFLISILTRSLVMSFSVMDSLNLFIILLVMMV